MAQVTIHSLAPEIIGRILELAAEREIFCGAAMLHSASLVCRKWSEEARILLWTCVYIWRADQIRTLLDSPALGRYRTMTLVLAGDEDEKVDSSAKIIVSKLRGIQRLELLNVVKLGMDVEVFSLPQLQGGTASFY